MDSSVNETRWERAMRLTVVIAPTMAIMTPAMADTTALIPEPMAENIEPCIQVMLVVG